MDSVRIKRGIKSDLPTELPLGELAFCTDTRELFVGMGEGASLRQVTMNVSDHVLDTLYLSIDAKWKDVRNEYDTELSSISNKSSELLKALSEVVSLVDDTTLIQQAIDKASVGNGYVKLKRGSYICDVIHPKSGVTLDLNGSTLKIRDNTNYPLFDSTTTPIDGFKIINGILDLNKDTNKTTNHSGGGIWINNSSNLEFKNLRIINGFRSLLNFYSVKNVTIEDVFCENCGLPNDSNFYTYGISFEDNCENILIKNFEMKDTYGFGIHIKDCKQVDLANITFKNTFMQKQSIGITVTSSENVRIGNYIHEGSDFLGIECNCSKYVSFKNIVIDNTVQPIIFGDNDTDMSNISIEINNIVTRNTQGANSLNLNYLNGCVIHNFNLDKPVTTQYVTPSSGIHFKDGIIKSKFLEIYNYPRFIFTDVTFEDNLYVEKRTRSTNRFLISDIVINNSGSKTLSIKDLINYENNLFGELLIYSRFDGNTSQCTLTKFMFFADNSNIYLTELQSLNGAYGRKVDVTTDGTNLVLTNNTGVDIRVDCNFK